MRPIQLNLTLKDALSAQNIRVTVPTTVTVAISQDPLIMQNAANRLLGVDDTDKESLISDIVYGQMRLIVASMEIEELNSNRDKFLTQARDNINTELNKLGLYLININISDIRDAANYIENLGQKETTKARAQAEAAIAEEEKKGAILKAEAKAAEILKEAEAKANATQMQLEAEAEGTKRKLLAEAEGKRASLMAEADKITAVEMAPAKAVEKMIECGMTPQMIVQYKTVDQLKGIAEASAEMYEHIHLGQVTVYGNENTAGSFMAKTAENLNPAFELLKSIPFKKTFKEMFVEDKKDNPTEDNFEAVK